MAREKEEKPKTGKGTGHKGRKAGSKTFQDTEMNPTTKRGEHAEPMTGGAAKKRMDSMTHNLSAKSRKERDTK